MVTDCKVKSVIVTEMCNIKSKLPDEWICTKKKGHKGLHHAHGFRDFKKNTEQCFRKWVDSRGGE